MNINLPEVQSFAQLPRFYKDDGKDYVEISFIGTKDTIIKRVTPEIMQKFRAEWDAYCDGKPMEKRPGTPLTTLPEISDQMAQAFIARNLHNLEELAVLNDHQCQALGHGMITLRKSAQVMLVQKDVEKRNRNQKIISELTAAAPPRPEAEKEMAELKLAVTEQAKKIDLLVDALSKLAEQTPRKKRKKDSDGPQLDS